MRKVWQLRILCFCLFVSQALAAETVTVTEVSGRTISDATLREWSAERIVVDKDGTQKISLDDLQVVTFHHPALPLAGADPLVILANGDRLVMRPVGVFDDELTATWQKIASRPAVKIPLESVAAIIFDLPAANDDRQKLHATLQTLPAGQDIVLLANGDRVQGDFERLDATFVHVKATTGVAKIDRSRVQAIRLNPELTTNTAIEGRRQELTLRDGSRFTATSVELSERDLKCVMAVKQSLTIPVTEVVACRVYGASVIPLADREPAKYTFVPYLSNAWPLVKNANVLRGPLVLRGTEYGTGLGVHSRSLITYNVKESDREFRATVGIDDSAAGAGSARFAIELDGKRIWESPELTGKSQPFVVPAIKLDKAKSMTLIVDFGANADVADHADWCDAVLIQK